MLFNEPPRTAYDLNFHLLGIPVRVHPFFWAAAVLLGLGGTRGDPAAMLVWVGAVFLAIIVHELGHALVVRAQGWDPRITLHAFGGLAAYQPTFHNTFVQIMISLAGPLAGFLFAALIVALLAASGRDVEFTGHAAMPISFELFRSSQLNRLIIYLMFINIFWGLINLLPIYPLDGGRIARELLEAANPREGLRQALVVSIVTAAGLAAVALLKWSDGYLAMFFGYLAYTNYATVRDSGPTGGSFGRWR